MATHRLDAATDTVHWGFFDAALKPLLTVESGDTVTISTVSGTAAQMPKPADGSPLAMPKALAEGNAVIAKTTALAATLKKAGVDLTVPAAIK